MRWLSVLLVAVVLALPVHAQVRPLPQDPLSRPPAPTRPGTPVEPRRPQPVQPRQMPTLGPNTTDHGIRITHIEIPRGLTAVPYDEFASGRYLPVTLAGLPPHALVQVVGARDEVEFQRTVSYPVTRARCIAEPSPNLSGSLAVIDRADAEGRLTIKVPLFHKTPAGAPAGSDADGPCVTRLVLALRGPVGQETRLVAVQSESYALPQFVTYTYTRTAALAKFFRFEGSGSRGSSVCTGTSIGPTQYTVGQLTVGGNLALRIRSGPLGTDCEFVSMGIAVPVDVQLESVEWEIVNDGDKCCAANKCPDALLFAPGFIPNGEGSLYQVVFQGIADNYARRFRKVSPRIGPDQHLVGFAHIRMTCEPTLVNDHGVTVILKSATFKGPPGLDLPPQR
jgi:hypothetical protein